MSKAKKPVKKAAKKPVKKAAKKPVKKAAKKEKMKQAEKNCVYICDVCGCEVVCTTPSQGALICCDEVMYCC